MDEFDLKWHFKGHAKPGEGSRNNEVRLISYRVHTPPKT